MNSPRLIVLTPWVGAAVALSGIVTLYHRWIHVNVTTVALTLLLLVLILAARWGLRYAVATSIAAAICFNYFFLPPIRQFTITDTQNWVALFAFLGTAVIASRMSDRIREEAFEARSRQREVEMLYQISREVLQTENVAELINAIPDSVIHITNASAAVLYLADGDRLYLAGNHLNQVPEAAELKKLMFLPTATMFVDESRAVIPLRAGVRPRGVLLLRDAPFSGQTLEALGGLISIAIDRAQALENVTRSEAAKESERLRSAMLDSITHELRTPLTAIKASATTLLSSDSLNTDDIYELLTVIDEESDRLNRLVTEAVEMSQLDTHDIHMSFTAQSIPELIQRSLEDCAAMLASREVKVTLPDDLPGVKADPVWIQKVLYNLLENAAKYSPQNQPIFITAERCADTVAVSIADRGVGIDPMDQSLIFDKFYRGREQRQHVSGTGMGLAICRAILEAHQGKITVTSQPGQGSVFTFTLPIAP